MWKIVVNMYHFKIYLIKFLKFLGFPITLIEGWVKLECHDQFGNLKWQWEGHNGITNAGFAAVAGLVGNTGTITAFTYLAIGTDSTAFAASQTALIAESASSGLTRAAATVSRVTTTQTNDTLQLLHTWTCGVAGPVVIQEVGSFNDPTTGIMLGRAVISPGKSLTNTDTLTETYQVKFS